MEKKEIIKLFLENEIQLTPSALDLIFQNQETIDKLISYAKQKNILIVDEKFVEEFLSTQRAKGGIKIEILYPEEVSEFSIDDVVRMMKERFQILSEILQQNNNIQNLTSLSRVKRLKEGEETTVIGMVKDKTTYSVLLEDLTSHETIQMDAKLVDKLFYDDVVGVRVRKEEGKLIGDKIFFPSLSFFRKPKMLEVDLKISTQEIKLTSNAIPIEKKEVIRVLLNDFQIFLLDVSIIEKYRRGNEGEIDVLISLIERRHLNPSFFTSQKIYKRDLFLVDEVPDALIVINTKYTLYKPYKGIHVFFLPEGKTLSLKEKKIE